MKTDAYCLTCKKDIPVKDLYFGTGEIRMMLVCGHARRIFISPRSHHL